MASRFINRAALIMVVAVLAVPFIDSGDRADAATFVGNVLSFRGNSARIGAMQGPGPSAQLGVLWRYGEYISTAPASDGSTIYVGARGGDVSAIDAASGSTLWQRPIGGEVSTGPIVAAGNVYAGNSLNFFALDARTGSPLWQVPTEGTSGTAMATGDQIIVAGGDGVVRAYSAADGTSRWQTDGGA